MAVRIENIDVPDMCQNCIAFDSGRNGEPDWCKLLHRVVDGDSKEKDCPIKEAEFI